jgi:hypothetical protein
MGNNMGMFVFVKPATSTKPWKKPTHHITYSRLGTGLVQEAVSMSCLLSIQLAMIKYPAVQDTANQR